MAYSRIQKYPDNANALKSKELKALVQIWQEKRHELENTKTFLQFNEKLQREWAIETGIIERLYVWDRGVTESLIEHGITSQIIERQGGIQSKKADHIKNIIEDQLAIVEDLFAFVKDEQPLTEHYIRGMQDQFTCNQDTTGAITSNGSRVEVDLIKGAYKKQPNNPRRPDGEEHEYCPPEITQEEMTRLVEWYL